MMTGRCRVSAMWTTVVLLCGFLIGVQCTDALAQVRKSPAAPTTKPSQPTEDVAWRAAVEADTMQAYLDFHKSYPKSQKVVIESFEIATAPTPTIIAIAEFDESKRWVLLSAGHAANAGLGVRLPLDRIGERSVVPVDVFDAVRFGLVEVIAKGKVNEAGMTVLDGGMIMPGNLMTKGGGGPRGYDVGSEFKMIAVPMGLAGRAPGSSLVVVGPAVRGLGKCSAAFMLTAADQFVLKALALEPAKEP